MIPLNLISPPLVKKKSQCRCGSHAFYEHPDWLVCAECDAILFYNEVLGRWVVFDISCEETKK